MKKKVLFVLALFFILTGFNEESRIVEQSVCHLRVNDVDGIAPKAVEKPKIIPAEDGSYVTMMARIIAKPKPTVTWYHGANVIQANPRIEIRMDSIGDDLYLLTLKIKAPISEDAGNYRINVKNDFGELNINIGFNM